ncbi:hypothetical protein [Kroppenstedtia eburnea]|uniref:Zinc dependent phospholipase C n=1 Tax=Kroppenstedtia eburnea TaxID=714067 RepID=A0A1N7Q5Y0_9BACL|nr:hypothetical protein [Kroppenstedtia eburnea]QKI83182.1 hypothetical protein GXN75_14910 [Kroppenstedtia eburnea]SIT18206.1 hypothetical protein SAMN05421790_1194 [Kroppenstedtia eburnea]
MPNVWSHILFGDRVRKQAGLSAAGDLRSFHLGCQGPDFLLYHNFWPWKRDKSVSRLGGVIHQKHCGPFLMDLILAAAEHPGMRDYVSGFLTHHILDRRTHPYIIYKSGDGKYKHQKLEVIIDTLLAQRLEGIRTWKSPVVPRIDIGTSLPRQWVEVLQGAAQKHFPKETEPVLPHHWNEGYQDMKRALSLFHDPTGVKWLFTLGAISPFRYRPIRDGIDYLNESGEEWVHPHFPKEKHRESFLTLWESALREGADLLNRTIAFWKGETAEDTLCDLLGNISYDTGKDCSSKKERPVFAPVV